ncbi:DNA-directed RNA polymerase III subunit RPC6 [Micractinium conductrix]|uniref:DNA-directed RNA polymerase III subunit RPC6 n=1 Tax=Micractinium conductrix TaxID=554055 RepID=A0A2P6V1J4_9CHLO|nr:DNA-directed RNA polymerase III subunit RPC6 [Micractinium conductrix]|eukprot:PSC67959.1 DNA-directed RNA polymerase III subunit RPC6 [Micractinium conductrix]
MSRKVEEMVLAVCRKHPEGVADTVLESELPDVSVNDRALAINSLLSSMKLQILVNPADPSSHIYKASTTGDTARFKGLTAEDMLVYQCIQAAGNIGIWTRDMKQRTNLQQPKVTKILKALEERLLVKSVKSVQNASRKVYMLYELEPAKELTGGPWFGPDAFDSEFVAVLQETTLSYIKSKGQPSLADIVRFIKETGISKQALQEDDVERIINTLEYDGKIEQIEEDDGDRHYRMMLMRIPESTPLTSIPCGVCPVFSECVEGGKISPATCTYYQDWLEQMELDF